MSSVYRSNSHALSVPGAFFPYRSGRLPLARIRHAGSIALRRPYATARQLRNHIIGALATARLARAAARMRETSDAFADRRRAA